MLRNLIGRSVRTSGVLREISVSGCALHSGLQQSLQSARTCFGLPFQIHGFKPDPSAEPEPREIGSPKVRQIMEDIVSLNLLEIADLTELLQKRLRMPEGMGGGMGMMMGGGYGAPAAAPAQPSKAEEEVKPVEKTEFNVKLDGFDAASKIKVIKEIRTITNLGLKEAKELVCSLLPPNPRGAKMT